ncbi:DNA-binding domain-containing protein, partial [Arcobacteraceae bacterium]|nr:DNA-binding domain-containing protein [Arcobacteraceae bacterium]
MKLSDIQNSFLDSVFSDDKSLDYILPTHSTKENTIAIYKDSINAQLINTLKVVFPICESMLGVEFFSAMSYEYIKLHPSESSSLNEYGKHMSIFMKNFKPLEDYPYFSDIALMEYAYDEIKRIPFVTIDNKDLSSFDESQYNGLVFNPVESLKT